MTDAVMKSDVKTEVKIEAVKNQKREKRHRSKWDESFVEFD
ncbi:hypothetical protein [Haladaptatus sp. DFWS20]